LNEAPEKQLWTGKLKVMGLKCRRQLYELLKYDNFKDKQKFRVVKKESESFPYNIDVTPENLEKLRGLIQHTPSLLNLLKNSNLHEHDSFTDMLWPISNRLNVVVPIYFIP